MLFRKLIKETTTRVFSCEIYKFFKNTFFYLRWLLLRQSKIYNSCYVKMLFKIIIHPHFPRTIPRAFHDETTWKRSFPLRFKVEYTWCVCMVPTTVFKLIYKQIETNCKMKVFFGFKTFRNIHNNKPVIFIIRFNDGNKVYSVLFRSSRRKCFWLQAWHVIKKRL